MPVTPARTGIPTAAGQGAEVDPPVGPQTEKSGVHASGQPCHLHGRQYHTGNQLPVVRGQESLFESCVVAGLIVAVIVVKAPPGQACLLLALCPLRPETVMQPLRTSQSQIPSLAP